METEQTPGLYPKLCKVMAQISRLPKSGYNAGQKYRFASESDLTDMIRPLLADQGVFLFSSMDSVEQTPIESQSGTRGTHTRATFTFTFVDAATGEMKASQWVGEAMDYQDKSINKAATAALKYFLLKTFLISTGEADDDADSATPEPASKGQGAFRQSQPIPQRQTTGDDPKQSLLNIMNKLGVEVYGEDWTAQRQTMIQEITKNPNVPLDKLMIPTIQTCIDKLTAEKAALASTPPAKPVQPEAA